MLIAFLPQTSVAVPAICMHYTPRLNRLLYKRFETPRRRIWNSTHADPANTTPFFLGRHDDQSLLLHFASTKALFFGAQVRFVDLHASRQPITSRPHHSTTQFVQPRPRGLVAAQTQNPLQTQGAGTRLQRRHPPDGAKPEHQRLVRVLEDRSGCHGGMIAAGRTNDQVSVRHPSFAAHAARTDESFRPAELAKVSAASIFRRKTRLEFCERARIIFHGPIYYIWCLLESSEYPLFRNFGGGPLRGRQTQFGGLWRDA